MNNLTLWRRSFVIFAKPCAEFSLDFINHEVNTRGEHSAAISDLLRRRVWINEGVGVEVEVERRREVIHTLRPQFTDRASE